MKWDAELGAFHSVAIGFLVAIVVAGAAGQLDDLGPHEIWPFVAIGVFVPGISQVLFVSRSGHRRVQDDHHHGGRAAARWARGDPFLDEPLRLGLLLGAMLVVGGAITLAWERTRPAGWQAFGVVWAFSGVVIFAVRDTSARWVIGERDVTPGSQLPFACLRCDRRHGRLPARHAQRPASCPPGGPHRAAVRRGRCRVRVGYCLCSRRSSAGR